MSYGKMNSRIDILSTAPLRDNEGFVTQGEHIVLSLRAYKEDRRGTTKWANMAAFTTATTLFRIRKPAKVHIDTSLYIRHGDERYNILSVENVRERGLYLEILAEKNIPTSR